MSGSREVREKRNSKTAPSSRPVHSTSHEQRPKEELARTNIEMRDKRLAREFEVRAETQVGSHRSPPPDSQVEKPSTGPSMSELVLEAQQVQRQTGRDVDAVLNELRSKRQTAFLPEMISA